VIQQNASVFLSRRPSRPPISSRIPAQRAGDDFGLVGHEADHVARFGRQRDTTAPRPRQKLGDRAAVAPFSSQSSRPCPCARIRACGKGRQIVHLAPGQFRAAGIAGAP
jgi:hypothetical protein